MATVEGNLEVLHKIWEWAEEELTNEEIKNRLLLGKDSEGKTAWHWVTKEKISELLHIIWKCAEKRLTTEEINNKLLLGTDSEG